MADVVGQIISTSQFSKLCSNLMLVRRQLDSNLVMAEKILHDVVNQPQSVDAQSSTDVSAIKLVDPTARAVVAEQPALDSNKPTPTSVSLYDNVESRETKTSNNSTPSSSVSQATPVS